MYLVRKMADITMSVLHFHAHRFSDWFSGSHCSKTVGCTAGRLQVRSIISSPLLSGISLLGNSIYFHMPVI